MVFIGVPRMVSFRPRWECKMLLVEELLSSSSVMKMRIIEKEWRTSLRMTAMLARGERM